MRLFRISVSHYDPGKVNFFSLQFDRFGIDGFLCNVVRPLGFHFSFTSLRLKDDRRPFVCRVYINLCTRMGLGFFSNTDYYFFLVSLYDTGEQLSSCLTGPESFLWWVLYVKSFTLSRKFRNNNS